MNSVTRFVILACAGVFSSQVMGQGSPEILWTQTVHNGSVIVLDDSPDGRFLGTGGADGSVNLLNTADGTVAKLLRGHSHAVYDVAFAPDSRTVATGSGIFDQTARIWDVDTGNELHRWVPHPGESVNAIEFLASTSLLTTASWDGWIKVWGLPNLGDPIDAWVAHPHVSVLAVDELGNRIASGGQGDGLVKLWRPDGTLIGQVPVGSDLQDLRFDKDSTRLYIFQTNGQAIVWTFADNTTFTFSVGPTSERNGAAVSADQLVLFNASRNGTIRAFDARLYSLIRLFDSGIVVGPVPLVYCNAKTAFAYGGDNGSVTFAKDNVVRHIVPRSYRPTRGVGDGAPLSNLFDSDDRYAFTHQRPSFAPAIPNAEFEFVAIAPARNYRDFDLWVELSCNGSPSTRVIQTVTAWDYQASRWDSLDSRNPTRGDSTIVLNLTGDQERYIDEFTGEVKVRVSWFDRGTLSPAWSGAVDMINWIATP